jgi:hypothetical protein
MSCFYTAEQFCQLLRESNEAPRVRFGDMARAWLKRRLIVFDFTVKGSVVGFNTSQDGTKTFVKIMPLAVNGVQLQRDERPGYLDILVAPGSTKNLAANSVVVVRGKGYVIFRDWRDPKSNMQKTFTNFRYEAEALELSKTA